MSIAATGPAAVCSVYFAFPRQICAVLPTEHIPILPPAISLNVRRVPELMDLTSPVTRRVLRLHIQLRTEVQCQRVPVRSHVEKGKRFNMGMRFMCASLPAGRVMESGRLTDR